MTSPLSSAIQDLQPCIDRLSQSCTEADVLDLTRALTVMSPLILQKLHPYVLVPIFGELVDSRHGMKVRLSLLDCALSVLKVVHLSDVSTILNLLNILMMELFDKSSPTLISAVPEEMKLSALRCTLAVIDNMAESTKHDFYLKNNIPVICHISYTCIQVAESEKLRTLRVCAMEVILSLLQVPKKGQTEMSSEFRKKIGDIFQYVLPGASAKLAVIVAGDVTQGSQVIQTAVCALSSMIAQVMEDYDIEKEGSDVSELLSAIVKKSRDTGTCDGIVEAEVHFSKDKTGMQKLIESSPGRTTQWRINVGKHLIPCLKKVAALHSHSNVKVCREVAHSCGHLLLRCPLSLREGLPPLLDALIILSVHEDFSVREECSIAISKLRACCLESNCNYFLELVEENFYMLLTRLPRIAQEDGGSRSASAIALVTGYVNLLSSSMKRVLSSSVHLQRLTLSLLHSLTLDCSGINVGQEHAIRKLLPAYGDDFKLPWTQLCFTSDGIALSSFRNLCSTLADPKCDAVEILGSQLMDAFLSVPFYRKECILALNEILLSCAQYANDHVQQFIVAVLDLYLSPEFWTSQERLSVITSVNQLQNDIAVACLLAEGVGCCAHALGAGRTKTLLLRIMYPLLERAGSANASLSLAGRRALTRISLSCGYDTDLMALLADNMDYITHCMTVRLRHYDEQCGVFDALSMILQHSSPSIAIGLHNIVQGVLDLSGCISSIKSNDAHLRVFVTFSRGVHQWLKPDCFGEELREDKVVTIIEQLQDDCDLEKVQSVVSTLSLNPTWKAVQKFKEYQQICKLEMDDSYVASNNCNHPKNVDHPMTNIHSNEEEEEDLPEVSEKEDIPELAKLLVLVLQRCIHFLPVNVVNHQFLALETLQAGLLALKPYPDTLLPIVHQIWNPLVGRLHASQPPLIIRAAFRLLLTMAYTARDFLMRRTLREVLPQICAFLKNSVQRSRLQDQGAVFRFSQMYKTQHALLSGLGPLVSYIEFRGQDFHSLLIAALPYLSCYQPRPLQVACKTLVLSCLELDEDATWWTLVSWWTPSSLANSLQLPQESRNKDCKDNITALLQLFTNHEI